MKKQSKSFKEAVSRVLDESSGKKKKKSNDELIEELYGSGSGGNYVPAGITVASKQGTGMSRGMMPPYSSMTDPGVDGGPDMRDLQPDNDVERPDVLPFPLETVKDHLGYAYDKLSDVVDQIKIATHNPALTEEKSNMLKKLDNKIKTIIGHIGKVTEEISDISLD